MSISILTIGYGGRSVQDLVAILGREQVQFLIDVRSNPISRFNPEFSREPLTGSLGLLGIRYVFMGDSLGGRPVDRSCYENGHVVYSLVQQKAFFKMGIDRLLSASTKGFRVCLLCSESRPEDCHRSKLIGVALTNCGVEIVHLGPKGEHLRQSEVIARLETDQTQMFDNGFHSRKPYRLSTKGSPVKD
jgi:uncharacterized protein (DUF488 family)